MRSSSPETSARKKAAVTLSGPSSAPLTRAQKLFSRHAASTGREKAAAWPVGAAAAVAGVSAPFVANGSSPRKRSASKIGLALHSPANAKCESAVRVPLNHRQTNKWTAGTATMEVLSTLPSPRKATARSTSFPFDVNPTQIFFDAFEANQTYTATLELRNHTAINTHVRVDRRSSCSAFELSAPHGAETSSKVAPGLSVTYTVVFKPNSNATDYETELVVRAESGEVMTVPVRAYASRGQLQLPAALTLREAPVKGTSCTPLFLRNISEHKCAWRAMVFEATGAEPDAMPKNASYPLSSHFSITPSNGVVEPLCGGDVGTTVAVTPVTVHFHPHPSMAAVGTCGAVLRFFLGPEGDVVQDVQLSAQVVELTGIALEKTEVTLEDTYVTTERQAVVRLRNDSNNTVHFAWKNSYRGSQGSPSDSVEDIAAEVAEFSGDGVTKGGMTGGNGRRSQLQQHSHNHSTMRDSYTGDEAFRIEPLSGTVYGHGVREFTITFNPSAAVLYESMAFLDVTGLSSRLILTLRGHGLGPRCTLEYSRLEIGNIYLNALHEYEVDMENVSPIECQYVIMPPLPVPSTRSAPETPRGPGASMPLTNFSSKFRFTPSYGTLGPGEIVKLRIELQSDRIGCFSEVFRVHMQGAVEEVPLLLKGRVLGPHFQCSVQEFVFGNVSYNMTHERTMDISNTSPIPMHYTLRLPDDCTYVDDLSVSPDTGVIAPMATQTVTVRLRSCTVGDYDTTLLVDVADVDDVLEAIPIKATCMVPPLFMNATELAFGGVFVGYPSTLNVMVLNNTALTGMFEFALVGGDALSDVVVVELPVSSEHEKGVHRIAPHQTMQMPVTMTALRPGKLHFSISLRVLGMDTAATPPQTILVSAVASGTHVELHPSTFQFGTVDVLNSEVKELTLKNTSPVPAPFSLVFDRYGGLSSTAACAAADRDSAEATLPFPRVPVFTVEPDEGVLEPHSSLTVRILARPDEAMAFSDVLRLHHSPASKKSTTAEETTEMVGNKPTVTVKVTGKGIPIVSERPIARVKLGDVLTTALVSETMTLYNYGRREQEVQWQNTQNAKAKERDLPPAFSYKPERAFIPAGGALTFTLCGGSVEPGLRTETFTLKQSGSFKEILRSTVSANFMVPTLSCSTRAIHFEFANTEQLQALDVPSATSLVKSFTMKNITSKTLAVSLRIRHAAVASSQLLMGVPSAAANGVPFELEGPSTISLAPRDSYVVGIRCKPLYRGDFTSHTTKATVQFSFAHHTRKEHISLSATLRFPALVMNPSTRLEFGSVLRNTEVRRTIVLSNPSADLPTRFEWALQPQLGNGTTTVPKTAGEGDVTAARSQHAGEKNTSFAINAGDEAATAAVRCFDIVPFTGMLLPGESRNIDVTYQGADCGEALATAVCRVHGGPTYTIDVHATSSVVQARCDRTEINFGRLPFYESATQSVMLWNSTLVPVPWDVDLRSMRHPECVRVSPVSGELRDKTRLLITFTPTVPDTFEETLWVRIGHLDPQPIRLCGSGYMNRLMIETTSPTAPTVENEATIHRAPFRAFTEALQYVEAQPGSSQHRSAYASRSVNPLPMALAATEAPSKPASNAPAPPTLVQREWPTLEAERLAFCRAVSEDQGSEHSCSVDPTDEGGLPLFLAPHPIRRSSATAVSRTCGTSAGTHKYVLARYVVDFGHLTRHDVRKVTLRLTNPSATEAVGAVLDSKELEKLPISVDPMKGIKVGPLGTTTLTLVMDATKSESLVRHGKNAYEFAIDVKHGPAIVVECRCYVATPTLRAAEKEVHFGPVLLGKVKVLPLVLVNPEAVPCPWRVTCKEGAAPDTSASTAPKRHLLRYGHSDAPAGVITTEPRGFIGSRRTAPESQFWVKKDHGVVEACGTTTIEVFFAPYGIGANDSTDSSEDAGSSPATATLRFRCAKGLAETSFNVKLNGSGFQYKVGFSKRQLQLPVVRPHQVVHESVTLTNNEDHPVEVFSLGLDTQHVHEIKLLRRAMEVTPDHEIFLPHLEAGSSLPDTLLESIFARLHAASESLKEAPPAVELEATEKALAVTLTTASKGAKPSPRKSVSASRRTSTPNPQGGRREKGKNGNQSIGAASGEIGKGFDSESAVADGIACHNQGAGDGCTSGNVASSSVVLIIGPPFSGKTTLARQLTEWADAGSVTLVDVDDVIKREADRDDNANGTVARFLLTQLAEGVAKSLPGTLDGTSATIDAVAASHVACAPTLVRDALHGHLRRCLADHAPPSAVGTSSLGESSDCAAHSPRKLLVFDGLNCTVLQNPWLLFELLKETCNALHIPMHIVSLAVSTPMSGVRRAGALEAHHEARVKAAALTLLSEAEFEALDKEAREDYTRGLKLLNDCRRDLKAAQQLKREYMAQLPHKTVQQEMEEAFTQAQIDLQQALALESTMKSARRGKAAAGTARGTPRSTTQAAEVATKPQELKWTGLDPATQFREWYTRFLTKYGTPPKPEGGEDGAIGATPIRSTTVAPPLKGAAAAAAAAAAEERANCWAAVVRVSAETETPSEIATVVESQLLQADTDISLETGAATNMLALPTLSLSSTPDAPTVSLSIASGEGQLSVSAGEGDLNPAAFSGVATTEASRSLATTAGAAATSTIGEWFYLNEHRLHFWGAEAIGGSRGIRGILGQLSSEEEVHVTKASVATATFSGASETYTPRDGAEGSSVTDTLQERSDAATKATSYVHFFSTMERDVIPAKRSSSRGKSIPEVIQQEEELTRWFLPPKSSVSLTLEFCGDHVGPYTEKCLFGVVGTLQQLCLTVSSTVALSDISRDPKDIFPVVKTRVTPSGGGTEPGQRLSKVYILPRKLFDFGPLLIPPPPVPKGRRRSIDKTVAGSSSSTGGSGRVISAGGNNHAHSSKALLQYDSTCNEETLTFVNREASEAEVTLSFLNEKEKTFVVSPSSFVLKSGASQQVSLRAIPEKVGDFTNTLLACIKDNPLPWKTEVLFTGARPTLTVNGCKDLEVNFGRLVLNRTLTKSFSLVNEGPLPLQWRLVPVVDGTTTRGPGGGGTGGSSAASSAAAVAAAQLPAELQCSALEGVIEGGGTYTLNMTFAPTHPCLYTRNMLFTVSYPGHPHQVLYESLPVIIKAEGYDVVLEWTREIHLGVLHVGEEKHETIRILNKSPYEVGYQLKLPKRLQKCVTLSSPSGTLRGMVGFKDAAVVNIDIVARLEREGELPAKLSLIEAAFFDVDKKELLYPVQSIPVTGEAWYTKYAVLPPRVNFGSCLIGQPRESTFELRNTGVFPLEYVLFNYRDAVAFAAAAPAATGGSDNESVADTPTAGGAAVAAGRGAHAPPSGAKNSMKASKVNEMDVVVGSFKCCPCQGIIPIGGAQIITVSTVPQRQCRAHETIGVRVAQSGPELERYGTPVEVSAYPAVPSIAADLTSSADIETIFEEQRVVYRLDQLAKGSCAYSKEERVFSFGTTLVGKRSEERFRIANSSPLPCTVVAHLEGTSVTGASGNNGVGNATRGSASGGNKLVAGSGANAAACGMGKMEGFDLSLDGSVGPPAQTRMTTVKMDLPPYESRFLTIGFTPASLRRFQAQIVAVVENPTSSSNDIAEVGQELRFGLYGEGTLPRVEVDVPPRLSSSAVPGSSMGVRKSSVTGSGSTERIHRRTDSGLNNISERKRGSRRSGCGSNGSTSSSAYGGADGCTVSSGVVEVLELPLTRVGAAGSRSFTLRNTGCVTAKVHLELMTLEGDDYAVPNSALTITPRGAAVKRQHGALSPHIADVLVPAGGSEAVELTYEPTKVETTTMRMRVSLRDNPFEQKEFHILTYSFDSPISFDGIDPSSRDHYDIGDCWIGVDKSCTFTVRNNTDSLVRYDWQYPEAVVSMVPSIGHLSPGAVQTITVVVRSESHSLTEVASCTIHVQSIQLLTSTLGGALGHFSIGDSGAVSGSPGRGAAPVSGATNAAITEWDNSMQSPKWVLREDDAATSVMAARTHSAAATAAFLSTAASMVGRRNLKQVLEAVPEPPYVVVDGVDVLQPLTLRYRCSVPTYECKLVDTATGAVTDLKGISFEQTYLMQKRVAIVRVFNTGSVTLPLTYGIATSGSEEVPMQRTSQQGLSSPHARLSNRNGASAAAVASGVSPLTAAVQVDGGALQELSGYTLPTADFAVLPSPTSPAANTIPVGTHLDLHVEFTPRAVGLITAELILSMQHSDPAEVRVPLQGVAECPLVHFNIPPTTHSDRGPTTGISSASKRGQEAVVVEFLARGLHTKAIAKFPVINPTAATYSYEWVEEGMGRGATTNGAVSSCTSGGFVSPFRCLTPMGTIAAGRQAEATFEFFADTLGVRESAWSFQIPGRAAIPFVLIGTTVEPNVYFHSSKVIFGNVPVGAEVHQVVVLENCDDVPFSFSWDKFSMEGTSSFLSVKPLRGTIAPYERLLVTVTFSPQDEVEYNVPLRCIVKRSSVPLSINVKGVGVNVHDSLQVEPTEDGAEPTVVMRGQPLLLNLDRVQVNSTVVRRFALRNTGAYPFQYSVEATENPSVSVEGLEGTIPAKQAGVIVFRYQPTCEEALKQCRLLFRIEGKVAYKVGIKATAYMPRLQLSFDHYDFGPRFISAYNNGLPTTVRDVSLTAASGVAMAVLQLTNLETEVVSVDCSMSAQNLWCHLDSTMLVVRPKESARLQLTFVPPEVRQYNDNLRLCFNALHTVQVPITGEGVVPRVEVVNPFSKFGMVRIGETRQMEAKLVCLSRIPTPISFAYSIDDDLLKKGFSVSLAEKTPAAAAATPLAITLRPKESSTVTLSFAPTQRMGEFNREVKMLVCGVEVPFLSVSGSCADAEVHLDTSVLVFRDVVIGSSAQRRVAILNSGDISQRFSWMSSLQKLRPQGEWTIFPASGYVRAHTELSCELRYTPSLPNRGNPKAVATPASSAPTQQTLTLELDSSPAISLTIESNCVTRPAVTETVHFSCRARETDVKMIEVYNPTEDTWTAEPVLDNSLWTCPTQLIMKPKTKSMLAVTYQPVRPTASKGTANAAAAAAAKLYSKASTDLVTAVLPPKDKATLFIPLPDGTGRCVALEGIAKEAGLAGPVQEYDGVVQVSLPLYFQVRNWSTTESARFRRDVEWSSVTRTDDKESNRICAPISSLIRVEGDEIGACGQKDNSGARSKRQSNRMGTTPKASLVQSFIELPPGTSRESVLRVTPLREGVYKGIVRFVPVDRYSDSAAADGVQLYDFVIRVRSVEVSVPTTVELRAALREQASFTIPLTNPLSQPAVFKLEVGAVEATAPPTSAAAAATASAVPDAFTFPPTVMVPAHAHAEALVQFFPLIPKPPATVRCTVTSAELGSTSVYDFRLLNTCDAAAPERMTRLGCPLGQHTNFVLRFKHYSKTNTEFLIRVNGEALGKGTTTFTRIGVSGGGSQGSVVKVNACPPPPSTSTSLISKGQEVAVEFSYEPSEIGEATETIEFVSPVAGTYTFPIVANCTFPERQGPFMARVGQNVQLPFKNVFSDPVAVTVTSDSPFFVPSRKTETIAAHKTVNVAVQCKQEDGVEVIRGRITITCVPPGKPAPNQTQQPIQWVYYVEATNASERNVSSKQSKAKK